METREFVVTADVGLHARPAAEFAKIAQQSGLTITVQKPSGPAVSASSPLRLLTLKVATSESIVVTIDTEDVKLAQDIFDQLEAAIR